MYQFKISSSSSTNLNNTSLCGFSSLNFPEILIIVISRAGANQMGAQIAKSVAMTNFIEGALDFLELHVKDKKNADLASEVLKVGFHKANTGVYEFGHKLAAAGRLASDMMAAVIVNRYIALGYVGNWQAYLNRNGCSHDLLSSNSEILPANSANSTVQVDKNIGPKSLLTFELIALEGKPDDNLVLLSDCKTQQAQKFNDLAASVSVAAKL